MTKTTHPEMKIWQYWETIGQKPGFVDDCHDLVAANGGLATQCVSREALNQLINVPDSLHKINEIANKSDYIRAALLREYGGIWLDSDAIVLKSLQFMIDDLRDYDFVGFGDLTDPTHPNANVRANIIASRPGGRVISDWNDAQRKVIDAQTRSDDWNWVGASLLQPAIRKHADHVKLYPVEHVLPVLASKTKKFMSRARPSQKKLDETVVVMLSNFALKWSGSAIRDMNLREMQDMGRYISHFVHKAYDPDYTLPKSWRLFGG